MIKICSILFLVLLGCKEKDSNRKNINNPVKANSIIMNSKDTLSINQLMLLTKKQAIEKYGPPSSQEQFILNDAQGEFRIGLHNIYSKDERLSETILIDEVTWEKDTTTWITVWYEIKKEKSEPKDAYLWKKGAEF